MILFLDAIAICDIELVSKLLKEHPSLAKPRLPDYWPLHYAVTRPKLQWQEARLHMVKMLLAAGADVEEPWWNLPLQALAIVSPADVIGYRWAFRCGKLLIDCGAHVANIASGHPLHIYWFQREAALKASLDARIAMWHSLRCVTRLPRDVVKLIVCTPEMKWLAWLK